MRMRSESVLTVEPAPPAAAVLKVITPPEADPVPAPPLTSRLPPPIFVPVPLVALRLEVDGDADEIPLPKYKSPSGIEVDPNTICPSTVDVAAVPNTIDW